MTYGNGPVTLIWLEWFDTLFKDYIQINPEKTLIRIVANTQSGSNSFQDLLRLFIQYSDNPILKTQWGYRFTYHWSYPLENSREIDEKASFLSYSINFKSPRYFLWWRWRWRWRWIIFIWWFIRLDQHLKWCWHLRQLRLFRLFRQWKLNCSFSEHYLPFKQLLHEGW